MAFLSDGGGKAVAGMHHGVVGKSEQFADERLHNFFQGATPEVRAANAAGEKRVACEKNRRGYGYLAGVGRKEEARAAWSVARCMDHLCCETTPLERIAFAQELMDFGDRRRLDAEKAGLHLHRLIERNIVAVHQNRSARVVVEFFQTADMVDVRVGADDSLDGELVAAEQIHDAVNLVARVEDDGFARDGIADDGTVALQQADGNGEVQQALAVWRSICAAVFRTLSIRHAASIASDVFRVRQPGFRFDNWAYPAL